MAIAVTAVFEVRSAGNDTNGGGFNSAAAGTDYSQTDTKRSATGTNDSTTDAVTNNTTTVTSATANFTTAIVGNLIYLSGSGTTTGWYECTARTNSTTITVDRATGSTGGTGVTMNIGGALATPSPVYGSSMSFASAATLIIWIKQATYTLTSVLTVAVNGSGVPVVSHRGYTSTRGDASTKPLFTSATNSVVLFSVNTGNSLCEFINISFSHTAGTRGIGIQPINANCNLRVINCTMDGCLWAINGDNVGARYPWQNLAIIDTEIKNCVTGGVLTYSGTCLIQGSWIHGNTGYGVGSANAVIFNGIDSVFSNNGSYGVGTQAGSGFTSMYLYSCVFYTNGGSNGCSFTTTNTSSTVFITLWARNNIFYGNTGYGLSASATPLFYYLDYNAYGGNTTAALQNLTAGSHDVTLSGDPVTSSSNFLLNGTAGAGASCKGAGFPGAATFGTGGIDIGAVQTPSSTPSYPAASSVYSGVNRGDGVTGTLHASNISTAAGHGSNLAAGDLRNATVVDDVTGTLVASGALFVAIGFGGGIRG